MPQIVQFTHPGLEHGPDTRGSGFTSWNQGSHKRKFMRCPGDYVAANGRLIRDKELHFWGEWEPPSVVASLGKRSDRHRPLWLHEPFLPTHIPSGGASSCEPSGASCAPGCGEKGSYQNTDPFVFNGPFRYLICKQARKEFRTITGMAKLERGSMILFGSTSGKSKTESFFQLDTVFVVADWIDYSPSDLDALRKNPGVSRLYDDLVISKAFPTARKESATLRLYRGATHAEPFEGMYSFAPARESSKSPGGFPRVRLEDLDFVTNNLNSAPRYTPQERGTGKIADVRDAWKEVRKRSREQGCLEGVSFRLPAAPKSAASA